MKTIENNLILMHTNKNVLKNWNYSIVCLHSKYKPLLDLGGSYLVFQL